jgi:nucleoside-diphosphate-sugar epimerase
VVGIDNFRTGSAVNLEHAFSYNKLSPRRFTLVRADIQAPELIDCVAGASPHAIFHLAAQVDVCTSAYDPQFELAAMCSAQSTFAKQAGELAFEPSSTPPQVNHAMEHGPIRR